MRITPVNYNYTNQKVSKNNNQPSFGMVFKPESLELILEQVFSKGPDAYQAFLTVLENEALDLGTLEHNVKQITATVMKEENGGFKILSECAGKCGTCDAFDGAADGTAIAGKQAAQKFIMAAKQSAKNANPDKEKIIANKAKYIAEIMRLNDRTATAVK